MKRFIIIIIIIPFLFWVQYRMQLGFQHIKDDNNIEPLLYLPSGKFLKVATLGYDQLLADLLWIRTVGYFGTHLLTDKEYPWLYHMIDIVTTLDPNFKFPYYFGGIVLSMEAKQVDNSNVILRKGMKEHPDYWYFPFLIGFNYFYHLNENKIAGNYLKIAAKLPNSPSYIGLLASRMYDKGGAKENAIQFLQEMYNIVEDPLMKKRIKKRIEEILAGKE